MPRLLLLLLSLTACVVQAENVYIAAASNFTPAMTALVEAYHRESDHRVKVAYGSSGKIYAQIRHGAPFHLFFSADQAKPLALEKAGLADPDSRFTYAVGALALWSAREGYLSGPERLQSGSFNKLALANPQLAPYGIAALQVLDNLQLTEQTQDHWVMGENIAQTYQFVSSGNAEMGFVALSQIMRRGQITQGSFWLIPPELYRPIRQDAVLLQTATNNSGARDFLAFLHTDQARRIIRAFGYQTPDDR